MLNKHFVKKMAPFMFGWIIGSWFYCHLEGVNFWDPGVSIGIDQTVKELIAVLVYYCFMEYPEDATRP